MTALVDLSWLTYPLGALDRMDASKWMKMVFLLCSLVVVSRIVKLVQGIRAVGSLPGLYIPFAPLSASACVLPVTWWNLNYAFVWKLRKNRNPYDRFGQEVVSFVPFLYGAPTISTRSLEVGKQILSGGVGTFDKSAANACFPFWGPNIVDAYGSQWRRHRRIAGPAFNNNTYATVWGVSRRLFAEMVAAQGWASKDVIEVTSVDSVVFQFSLIVFLSAGFGMPLTWTNSFSEGDEPSVYECAEIIAKTSILALIVPPWAWKLPVGWVQRARRAYDTMRTLMESQVNTMRESIRSETGNGDTKPRKDLFSLLVHASEDAGGKKSLSDKELIGNLFSFFFAGHDTTAHSLAATLAFLALDFDVQDELALQVREVTEGRDDDTLLYEDYGKLDKVLAAFYEGVRMFPAGPMVPREATSDTVLNVSDTNEPKMLAVKKGTQVMVDIVGIHYHPKYFPDPEVYRPSRWYVQEQNQDSDGKQSTTELAGFSLGPRSCLGRKYSTTEAVCFLAHLLRDWRVEPLFAQRPNGQVETTDEWRERVLQGDIMLTLGIKDYSIRFVRRK